MTALQIIQTDGVIIHIVTVAEGIVFAQIVFSITLDRDNLTPSIVFISYDLRVMTRQNANDVALKIVLVEETCIIEVYVRRLAVGIVIEMQSVCLDVRFSVNLSMSIIYRHVKLLSIISKLSGYKKTEPRERLGV